VLDLISLLALVIVLALCLSILVFQGVTGVPPLSSSSTEAADVVALLKQAGLGEQAIVYELGCGWGSLVVALASAFPDARIRGIEMSPLPYWVARLRTRNIPNVSLRRGNFYDFDLTDAQAVTCYLMIKAMPKLADFLDRMLKPATPVVSLTFWFRDREVAAVREGSGPLGATALYYWPARRRTATRSPPFRPDEPDSDVDFT
jgi:methyltransferase family protein